MNELLEQSVEVLRKAKKVHGDRLVYPCSFGAESAVLLEIIHYYHLNIPVVSLDTGRLPQATYDAIEAAEQHYGMKVKIIFPEREDIESMLAEHGVNLFKQSLALRKMCCQHRKVAPLNRALEGYQAWITGRRAEQSTGRAELGFVDDKDPVYGRMKYNPLARWNWSEIMGFIRARQLPHNALLSQHYQSIGCECCTRPITVGEDARAGRWWWEQEDAASECGLHVTSLIRNPGEGEQGDGI